MPEYDAIIVGAGAGGGIVAAVLAEAGRSVLLLDRGRVHSFADERRDHLRNHRLALYGHNTGPDAGHPRVFVDSAGREMTVPPWHGAYHHNASAVGGGTLVYGAQAWRFMPQDFRMASTYGVPADSSLADWPIGYEDLAAEYERAEREIGVAGDASPHWPPGARYPLPPVAVNPQRVALDAAARRLGWPTQAVPLLINTAAYNGRGACSRCAMCVGFQCPDDAKNGTQNTVIPRAVATGRCTVLDRASVTRLVADAAGRITGVTYFRERDDGGVESATATARVVVVAAGAIETARLLLASPTDRERGGIGNNRDLVGRNLQGHYYPGALGIMPGETFDGQGPGVSVATTRFNHHNPGVIGGAMLANEFIKLPIIFWRQQIPPDIMKWGHDNKRFMRECYRRGIHVQGPVQEIPTPHSRVTLDAAVRDKFGMPVARLSGVAHAETVRTAEFIRGQAERWLNAAGAQRVWSNPVSRHLSAGQHQAGTCRMGADESAGVTDSQGRVFGHENLFVADGSLHVTNGGFNPVLTIMALAYRVGAGIVAAG